MISRISLTALAITIRVTLAFSSASAITMTELLETNTIPTPVVYGTNNPSMQLIMPFLPEDACSGGKRPAMVLIHGGGWRGGDPTVFYPAARYFASRGMPSFSIGYRLAKQETNAPGVPECLADCRSAMRYLRAHAADYGIDPGKIAVIGDSAGGHLAACLGTIPDPQDVSGVSSAANLMILCNPIIEMGPGEGNINSWFRLIQKGAAMEKNPTAGAIIPTPGQVLIAKSVSPMSFVSAKTVPALVMHGLDDTVVPPSQSGHFVERFKKNGVSAELILIQNARHAFILPKYTAAEQQVVDTMLTVDRFLTRNGYLQGEPTLLLSAVPAWTPKTPPVPKASPSVTAR